MSKWIKRIGIILVILALGAAAAFASFYISKKYVKSAEVVVTFEDSESYIIPEVTELSEDEALKLWPYIMHLENKGEREASFNLVIKDVDGDIKRDNLSYALMNNDKKLISGKLKDIKNNILYEGEINKKEKLDYKLYVWVNKKTEGTKYEYSIKLEFDK